MPFREFITRHRIASAVVAPATLGVAAIVAASWALLATPKSVETRLTSSVTECHDMVTISVAGRNDSPNAATTKMLVDAQGNALPAALSDDYHSTWVDPVVNAPAAGAAPGSYAAVYVAYPANMNSYEDAVTTGVTNTEKVMRDIAVACPNTKFSIVGYSEGADVVRRVATQVGHQDPATGTAADYAIVDPGRVLGVVILADAGRSAGDGPFPGAQDPNHPDGFGTTYRTGGTPTPGQGVVPGSGDFGALNGKIASFCSDGDLTCSAPQNISLLQLAANVGRQLNVDALQKDGLTPATGQDVAVVLGRIAIDAFQDIRSQPNWMQSNETFLQVLLKVSDPGYQPGRAVAEPAPAQSISTTTMSPLAYLPQKVLNEIVGLIVTNQNTIPVIMSDPYQQTLAPGTGHHFDYWHDSDPANGKPLTSAEYAAAWLTYLSKQAQAGKQVDATVAPQAADIAAAYKEVQATAVQQKAPVSASAATTPTASPAGTSSSTPNKPSDVARRIDVTANGTGTPVAPTTSARPSPIAANTPATTPTPSVAAAPVSPAPAPAGPAGSPSVPSSPAPAAAPGSPAPAAAPAKPAPAAVPASSAPAALAPSEDAVPVSPGSAAPTPAASGPKDARKSTATTESVMPDATSPATASVAPAPRTSHTG